MTSQVVVLRSAAESENGIFTARSYVVGVIFVIIFMSLFVPLEENSFLLIRDISMLTHQ